VLLPFIKDGFECGDKAVHVVNPDQRHDHQRRLAAVGIDPAAAEQSGQLEVRINTKAHLRAGCFDKDRMLAAFERMASGNAEGGFPLSRICCRMDWAIADRSYTDHLVEFESRVNDVWRRHEDAPPFEAVRLYTRAFSSAEEFLASDCVDQTRRLILDVAMPGMTGPDLQRELMRRRQAIPIIFITPDRGPMVRQRLIEQGAVECLFKPFSDTALLEALNAALRVN
jgi:CheY-like chemotaxis protein